VLSETLVGLLQTVGNGRKFHRGRKVITPFNMHTQFLYASVSVGFTLSFYAISVDFMHVRDSRCFLFIIC